ncbi:histidine kinase [Streptomyces sp. NPDC047043]|uniref:sensor histidine kinase n=1 Tax=Streptomyces sp. NPDC047043 TaxID=3154497 RepID=UPI0033D5C92C
MSPERAAAAADASRGTAGAPSPGLDAAWASHPVLDSMLRGQNHRRQLDRRHPWLFDTAVVLIVALISLPDLLTRQTHGPFGEASTRADYPTVVLIAFAAALVVPLWWRRKAPAVTYFVILSVSLVQWSLGVWQQAGIAGLVALYTLASRGSLRLLGWAAALTFAGLTLAICVLVPVQNPLLGLFFLFGTTMAAMATGLTLRIRRMYLAALEDRAARLEIERDQRVQLTAAAERARVAREMHDIVGHNLSVMVSVADGAATLATNRGEQSAEALRILADTGRQAMSELRRVLGVLRENQPAERPLNPQPGIPDLDPLLTRVRAAGLPVAYRTVGNLDTLSSGVQLTIYRIVQESLTNTLKHGGQGATAEVSVTSETGRVHIRIADTGTPPTVQTPTETQTAAPGHGLVGVRQRAAMYGGEVTIGPRDTGNGWLVDVSLDASTDPPPPGDPKR